jgi:hypothetical protein
VYADGGATPLEPAQQVRIVPDGEGHWFLLRYGHEGAGAGDTWHPTDEEAQRQAAHEYEIRAEDWVEEKD